MKIYVQTVSVYLTFITIYLIGNGQALAQAKLHVFDIRRPLPMSEKENPARDFYLSGGRNVGLKEGMIYTITRRIAMHDPYQNRSQGDITVPVARLKIIYVDEASSVARFHSLPNDKDYPSLEYAGVLIGDSVDAGSAFDEKRAPAKELGSDEPLRKKASQPVEESFTTVELKPVHLKGDEAEDDPNIVTN